MATIRIRLLENGGWEQVVANEPDYETALEVPAPRTIEGTRLETGAMFGGTSAPGVLDINEDEARISTGVAQFGLTPSYAPSAATTPTTAVDNIPLPESIEIPDFNLTGPPSESVRAIQQQLIEAGLLEPGQDDGYFGPITYAAAEQFNLDQQTSYQQQVDAARVLQQQQDLINTQLRSDYENLSSKFQSLLARFNEEELRGTKDAYDTLHSLFVVELGLPETLMDGVMQRLIDGDSDLAVAQWLRGTDEYKDQFPEMERRAALGLPRISEGDSLALRRAYRSSLRQAGIDPIYYDEPIDFVEWIVGDVSEAELQTRIGIGEAALRQANAMTKQMLKDLYNIDEPDLLAYYLNPLRTKDIFEAKLQLESAGISAASLRSTGEALGVGTAERLQSSGVTSKEVELQLSRRAALLDDLLGSEGVSADTLAEGQFGTDADAVTAMRRVGEERLAPFQRQGGGLRGSMGENISLGTAQ